MNKIEFLAASLPYGLKIHGPSKENVYDFIGFSTSALCRVSPIDKIDDFLLTAHHVSPIIRHIDTLTQECIQEDYNDGKSFIPIVELARIAFPQYCIKFKDGRVWIDTDWDIASFNFNGKDFASDFFRVFNQLQLFQHLLKFHFWPNKPEGEDVVYVTEEFNPYKKISMKTEFTKGEWFYRPGESDVCTTENIKGNIICEAPGDDYEESMLNWEANAKLIAAAPDLFEACQRALQVLDSENIFGQARLLLVSAIKKATE